MKVLQINNYYYLKGGAERVFFETSKLLEEKGHKVIHFSVNDVQASKSIYKRYFIKPYYFDNNFLEKIKSAFRFVYSKEARANLESLINKERPDVAHLHIFYGRLTSSILPIIKKYKIPSVMTVHEFRLLCPVSTFLNNAGEICEKCANGNYFHCILNKCNKGHLSYSFVSSLECYMRDFLFNYVEHIDKFIMVSKFILEKHLQYRINLKHKVTHIYNFVDIHRITPNYLKGDYYLYFGRLSKIKGLLTLIKAWKKFPNLKLKIVGDGDLENTLSQYLRENNIDNVELVGYLSGSELSSMITNSKFVIVPSEWYENNPMSIIESQVNGKPVIASRIGGIPEIVRDSVNGFLFESKNIHSLIESINLAESISEAKYRELSHAAREHAETYFDKEIYYEKLIKVYNEIS